jgi:hypothetical protein
MIHCNTCFSTSNVPDLAPGLECQDVKGASSYDVFDQMTMAVGQSIDLKPPSHQMEVTDNPGPAGTGSLSEDDYRKLEVEYIDAVTKGTSPNGWTNRFLLTRWMAAFFHQLAVSHVAEYLPKFDLSDVNCRGDDVKEPFIGNLQKQVRCLTACFWTTPFLVAMSVIDTSNSFAQTLGALAGFLGTSWFIITFDKISHAHLIRGLGDYITEKMLEPFLICFSGAFISIGTGWVKTVWTTDIVANSLSSFTNPYLAKGCEMGIKAWLISSSIELAYRAWRYTLAAIVSFDQADLVNMGLTGQNADNLAQTAENTRTLQTLVDFVRNFIVSSRGGGSRS